MFGSNCRIICGASVSMFTEHFGPCSSLPISACSRAIYAVYTGYRDDCRGAGRAYSKICHFRRTDLLLTRNIDGGPFGCVASQSQKAGITLRQGAFKQQQQQSGGWGVFWGSFEDRIRVDPLCLWRVGPLHLQVQTRSSAATPGGCVAKMLTVEEVYKNTVLPSQIINVSTIDSVLGRPIYTKLNGVSSDVEVDPVNIPVEGERNIWSSTANISRLQSDSVTELKRFPRRVWIANVGFCWWFWDASTFVIWNNSLLSTWYSRFTQWVWPNVSYSLLHSLVEAELVTCRWLLTGRCDSSIPNLIDWFNSDSIDDLLVENSNLEMKWLINLFVKKVICTRTWLW